jgi:hypothetical protein
VTAADVNVGYLTARIDDRALVAVMGNMHLYGDPRMPVPGALSVISAAVSGALAALSGRWVARAVLQGLAVAALCVPMAS